MSAWRRSLPNPLGIILASQEGAGGEQRSPVVSAYPAGTQDACVLTLALPPVTQHGVISTPPLCLISSPHLSYAANPGQYQGPGLGMNRTLNLKASELCSGGQVPGLSLKFLGKTSFLLPLCTNHTWAPTHTNPYPRPEPIRNCQRIPSKPVVRSSGAPTPGSCPMMPQAGSPHAKRPTHITILSSVGPAVARSHSGLAARVGGRRS